MALKITRFPAFLLLLMLQLSTLIANAQVKDAGLWTSVNLEAKLVKKLSLSISEELRFNENVTELGAAFTDVGLSYKLNKHFQFGANYRFIQRHRVDDYYSFRHRFYIDAKYSHKLKPFEVSLRTRLQNQVEDIGRAADGGIPVYYLRNKLSANWNTRKAYTPYVSLELFSPLNYPREVAFDGIRTVAGVEYEFTKHHKVDAFYLIQKELNVERQVTDFVIGIGYYYKL
jgi:Protein of unknown function (DUF2490)